METLYLLVPLSLMAVAVIVGALWWAVGTGQYDDLKAPAESILLDRDLPPDVSPRDTP
ncbi:cbb3-type cytochrome oxidase assembly protein CcoS [Ralstonia pseudosolanacearum]|uniref:Cbb3-type cytochrome oxidase assembly protein CcoS n=1 Tax=Ralstonia solanacearum TaxID=305 RepID=A0AA92K1S0_RALSL|nr:cbb3-type cytochrome oxidase assembly protein CcoS [Ralstonia pseudosolanacearum]QOK97009.1 cbb3-type cytochrome oxidase assembly protein CcoS [Ralstonia pseudosolanacearum]